MLKKIAVIFFTCCCVGQSLAKQSVIIDTDMGFDDWAALIWVLNDPIVDVKAITIDCHGLTYCPQGAKNAARLVKLVGKKEVPIYVGKNLSDKQNRFPKYLRDYSSEMQIPGYKNLPYDPFLQTTTAAEAIVQELVKTKEPIAIISTGTASNLADAYLLAKKQGRVSKFAHGLKQIYKGGGAFSYQHDKKGLLENEDIAGNLRIPFVYYTDNSTAEWNIFASPKAMQILLDAKLPITFLPANATSHAKMSHQLIQKLAKTKGVLADFVRKATLLTIKKQGGWKKIAPNLEYWDTASAIMSLHPDVITKQYSHQPVCINLAFSKPEVHFDNNGIFYTFLPRGHSYYGTTIIDRPYDEKHSMCDMLNQRSHEVTVVLAMDKKKFEKRFLDNLKQYS